MIDINTLLDGSFVRVSYNNEGKVIDRCRIKKEELKDKDITITGIPISAEILKEEFQFEEPLIRRGYSMSTDLIKSIESSEKCFVLTASMKADGYALQIDADGVTISNTFIKYAHQLQGVVAALTGIII